MTLAPDPCRAPHGARSELRRLFEEAEESAAQLDSYLDERRVLVAVAGDRIVGHLQLVDAADTQQIEIKNACVSRSTSPQSAPPCTTASRQ